MTEVIVSSYTKIYKHIIRAHNLTMVMTYSIHSVLTSVQIYQHGNVMQISEQLQPLLKQCYTMARTDICV